MISQQAKSAGETKKLKQLKNLNNFFFLNSEHGEFLVYRYDLNFSDITRKRERPSPFSRSARKSSIEGRENLRRGINKWNPN